MIPTTGTCRRPAIRSTSGLTTRAMDLISRLVRGPRRRAFPRVWGGVSGSAAAAGLSLLGYGWSTGVSRRGGVDIMDLPCGRAHRPALHLTVWVAAAPVRTRRARG